MPQKSKTKTLNLSNLDGVYDVTINKAAPSARRMRDASKSGKAVAAAVESSQKYDDARERAVEYGYDPKAPLPRGFFD
jgi:hypothetical protein